MLSYTTLPWFYTTLLRQEIGRDAGQIRDTSFVYNHFPVQRLDNMPDPPGQGRDGVILGLSIVLLGVCLSTARLDMGWLVVGFDQVVWDSLAE